MVVREFGNETVFKDPQQKNAEGSMIVTLSGMTIDFNSGQFLNRHAGMEVIEFGSSTDVKSKHEKNKLLPI